MELAMTNKISRDDPKQKFNVKEYSANEKKQIIAYMKSVEPSGIAGKVYDCVEGELTTYENLFYENNGYVWNSQDVYHIEKYNAAVKEDFLKKAVVI